MYRRRVKPREIQFSFDCFLDVVANICGIIIRLILVTSVGARAYHAGMEHQPVVTATATAAGAARPATAPAAAPLPPTALASDPLEAELARQRQALDEQQRLLMEELKRHQDLIASNEQQKLDLSRLVEFEGKLQDQAREVEGQAALKSKEGEALALSVGELKRRGQQLAQELKELEKLPPPGKVLKYRTPVSRPVHSEELHFECRGGRIAYIDLPAFLSEIRRSTEDVSARLKTQWEVENAVGPIGAFRLRYVMERERGPLDGGGGVPNPTGSFRYGLSGWVVEPTTAIRGDDAKTALAANSEFRRLVDALDPEQTVITLWVYPDSFALYRQLRDYLHERNIEVAGRPLPMEMPIASSRKGTASRGQ